MSEVTAKKDEVSMRSEVPPCAEGGVRRLTTTEALTGTPSWIPWVGWLMTVSSSFGCSTREGAAWEFDADETFCLWPSFLGDAFCEF